LCCTAFILYTLQCFRNLGYYKSSHVFPDFDNYVHPPNWQKNVTELDLEDPENNGYDNEDLIVWMRTAALPTFRKLYRKVELNSLPAGEYELHVNYSKILI
jgi:hypothetical protein